MPFEKGKATPGAGRKGYELERQQLQAMRNLVDKDLKVVEKIYKGKATQNDFKILQALQVRVGKYLDKLHAGKVDMTSDGEPLQVIVPPAVAATFGINATHSKTGNNDKE